VTVVEGSAFCISDASGDISPLATQGLFFVDRRLVSRFELRIDDQPPEALVAHSANHFSVTFVARARPRPGQADSTLLLFRHRFVGRGMREDLRVQNFSEEAVALRLQLCIEADFADVFAVKEGRVPLPGPQPATATDGSITFSPGPGGRRRGLRVSFSRPARLSGEGTAGRADFDVTVPARGEWSACVQLTPLLGGEEVEPHHLCGEPVDDAAPGERLARWRQGVPLVKSSSRALEHMVACSVEDLAALRASDPDHPGRTVVYAGLPWFMTLFGRDSLITAWMSLLAGPDIALGVLQTLADLQGHKVDPATEEEPGRILHEVRFGEAAPLSMAASRVYYGTVDATPLFVMLLGELRRWGLAPDLVEQLIPHADRALEWIERFGDRDGDGYVEYERATSAGLANQGWKDSWDGVRSADGSLPVAPIAMAEVQGYVYGAYLARHHFAVEAGDAAAAEHWRQRAAKLKEAFNRDFWLANRGWFAMALDADKRPVDALASNMGHCLWTGIVDFDKAAPVADRLLSPELFSGWGVRTLATSMAGYNPIGYHTGSVWPHDNAIIAAGLMRYGFVGHAHRVITAMTDASAVLGGRLPELFSGLAREDLPTVVNYPASCMPQAWAAAAPLSFVRTLLRLDPWVPHGKLWLAPDLPPSIADLRVQRIPLQASRLSVEVERSKVSVEGLPPDLDLIASPRRPHTAG